MTATNLRRSALIAADEKVLVQGLSGRMGRKHAALMKAYGTRIVGGVAQSGEGQEIDGIPVFRTCAEAVAATGATASVAFVPPLTALLAVQEAIDAGLRLLVTVAEGVPIADATVARLRTRTANVRWIGPSTPGLAIPGKVKLGFIPDVCLRPGCIGVMAKSGTLSYEVCYRLVGRGLGQSLWVGVGGDPVKGMRFSDVLKVFIDDPGTDEIVVIGEVGGNEEEELAAALKASGCLKPVFALVAGQTAKEGVTMGHAGALVFAGSGTMESKRAALTDAGARVFTRIQDLVDAVATAARG